MIAASGVAAVGLATTLVAALPGRSALPKPMPSGSPRSCRRRSPANRVIPEGAGPCQAGFYRSFARVSGVRGHAGLARGLAAQPGAVVCLVPRLLPIRVSGPWGQGPGVAWPAKPAPSGVLDAAGRDPIIGRRGTGGCVVVVVAGPMGSSSAGAPGCGHPSGWPAAAGRGAWGWSARAAGSIRAAAAARGGARHGSDHALPAAGPAHPASCSAAGVSSALTCPSRIA